MARANRRSGEATSRPRRTAARAAEPARFADLGSIDFGLPPLGELLPVAEPATVPSVERPPPAGLPSRLARVLELLEAPTELPTSHVTAGAHRRANKLGHALDQARAAVRRALELARQG
jgi:hypothetical protein